MATDEDEIGGGAIVAPLSILSAVEQHVHPLEDEAPLRACEVDDALGAEDVRSLLSQELRDLAIEAVGIEGLLAV